GTWTGAAPTCAPSPCAPNLTAPTNGTVTPTSGTTGTVATYACNTGFTLSGSAMRTCQTDGTWGGSAPTCVANACTPNLTAPTNGTVSATTGTTGATVTYTCNAGYTLTGSASTTCQASGSWNNPAPTCTPNACAPNLTAPTNGTVTPSSGVTGDVATYASNA